MTCQPYRLESKAIHRAAALLLALALIVQPIAVFAAPISAPALAPRAQETTLYEDPNGMFALEIPTAFAQGLPLDYEAVAEAPLDELLGSYGHIWGDDGSSSLIVMTLLLGEVIDDADEFGQFVAALKDSLGGTFLPDTDIEVVDEESLVAVGILDSEERYFLIGILAESDAVAIVIVNLDITVYEELTAEVDAALSSFEWDGDAVRAYFAGEAPASPEPGPEELESVTYDDPDGIFTIEVPALLAGQDVTYEDSGGEPIEGVLASRGRVFRDADGNAVVALFLLLDEEIADAEAMLDFALRFQGAAGGQYLPQADLQVVDEDTLVVAAEVDIPERYFLIALQGAGSVVAIFTISVDPALREAQGDAVSNTLNSFDWEPEVAAAVLTAQLAKPEPTPEAPETPTVGPTETLTESVPATTTEPVAHDLPAGGDLEFARFDHPDGAFTLLVPVGLEPELVDPKPGGYGYAFNDPADTTTGESDISFPPLAVSLVGTGNILDPEANGPLFTELTDDEFAALIDQIVTELGDLPVVTDIRNAATRTAYVVIETGPLFEDGSGLRLSMWVEENAGLLAIVTAIGVMPPEGEEDNDPSPIIFQRALTSFALDTEAAKRSILDEVTEEGAPPVMSAFADPFGLTQLSTPQLLAFRQAVFQDGGFTYSFSNDDNQAVLSYSLKEANPQAYTADEWAELVEISGDQLMQNAPGENPEILSSEVGVPAYAEGNSAFVRGQTGRFQVALVLHEIDGVMATSVFFLRNDLWNANEAAVRSSIDAGSVFDPAAVRAAAEARADLPFAVTSTTLTGSIPASNTDIPRKYTFGRSDSIVALVGTDNPELAGEMNLVMTWEQRPDLPTAAFAADLEQESIESADIVVRRDEESTRVAFALTPDYPLPEGRYRANAFYGGHGGLLFAAHEFVVTNADQPETPSVSLSFLLLDPSAPIGAPPVSANVLQTGDLIAVRGTGDIPGNPLGAATLRLFWYDPSGALLADAVQTVRPERGYLANVDYFWFAPRFPWQPGSYSYLLTLDGETLTSGGVQVIDPGDEAAVTEDGGDLLAALPLPEEGELAEVVEGIDLAVVATVDFPTDAIYGLVAAFLRGQGWRETLPTPGASPDFYFQRWVKEGNEVVITPGAGEATETSAGQVWIDYRALGSDESAPLPLGVPLAADTLTEIGEVAALPLAQQTLRAAAFSPDGVWIAALTPDGWLVLLDARTLDVKQWWTLDDAGYSTVAFSPDSGELAATVAGPGGSRGGYPVHIFKNYELIWLPVTSLIGHRDVPFGIAYTASDEILLTTGLDGLARFWNTRSGIPATWRASSGILDVDFTPPDNDFFLASLDDRSIEVWGIADPAGEEEPVYSFDVLADADFAAPQVAMMPVANEDGSNEIIVYGGSGPAEWWFVRADGADVVGAEMISPVPPDNADFDASAAAFSPDGGIVVIGGPSLIAYERATGSYLGAWDVTDANGEPLDIIRLSFSPDGTYLLIVTSDGALHLWAAVD